MVPSKHAVLIAVVLLGCTSVVADDAETYTGEVLIRSTGSAVLIAVDANKRAQSFKLESADPVPPISEHLAIADVVHSGGYLRVTSRAQRVVYDFVVTGHDRELGVPEGFAKIRSEGYGLSHQSAVASGTASDCISGGEGATSCRTASDADGCSVTCGGGYYACCDSTSFVATCKPYPN